MSIVPHCKGGASTRGLEKVLYYRPFEISPEVDEENLRYPPLIDSLCINPHRKRSKYKKNKAILKGKKKKVTVDEENSFSKDPRFHINLSTQHAEAQLKNNMRLAGEGTTVV